MLRERMEPVMRPEPRRERSFAIWRVVMVLLVVVDIAGGVSGLWRWWRGVVEAEV